MNNNVRGLIVVAIVVGGLYFYYKKALDSKAIVIKRLDSDYGKDSGHKTFVNNADKDYIKSWAKAIRTNQETFNYNGSTYWTKGGTTKK